MGVPARIITYAPDAQTAETAAASAFHRINQLDAIMSDYRPSSDLSKLSTASDTPSGSPAIPVPDDLFDILQTSRQISEASDGAFDVTVGPAVTLWRSARKSLALPDDAARRDALSHVDFRSVVLDVAHRTVQLTRSHTRLDLGGIAKGYAAQAAVDHLGAAGLPRSMVAMAGDIVVGDPPPGLEGWRIAITGEQGSGGAEGAAKESRRATHTITLSLANAAVSTSGDTEQYVEIAGKRYSHIIDPRTGLGIAPGVSVTVVSTRGELADALATAACILDRSRARAMIDQFPQTAAIFETPPPAPGTSPVREFHDPANVIRVLSPKP